MSFLSVIILAATIFCVVHAARSGRFWPWGYVVIFLPGFGAAAYFLFEILPEWRRAPAARRAQTQLAQAIDPNRRYRALRDELEFTDTIGNRADLAQECLTCGRYEEALQLYDGIIALPQGDEPAYFLGKAKAQFALDRPADVLATLDHLQSQWPKFRSQEGHLVYARALEAAGRPDEALREYATLETYYAGAEPSVRHMLLLDQMGRGAEAKQIAAELVKRLEHGPKFARKQQAEWLSRAKAYLKA
jgi:hypothetical protein